MKKAISLTTTAGDSLTILATDIIVVEAYGANYKVVYKDFDDNVKAAIVTDTLSDIQSQAECLFEVDGVYLSTHHTEFVAGNASGAAVGYRGKKYTTSDSKDIVVNRINRVTNRGVRSVGEKISDDFVRDSLGDVYTVVGTFSTSEIVSNKLQLAYSGAVDWSRYIYRNDHFSCDLEAVISMTCELTDISPASSGVGIRLEGGATGRDYTFRLFTASGATQGRLDIQFSNASTNQVTGAAYLALSQGDTVTLKVALSKNEAVFTAKNVTTGQTVFASTTLSIDLTATVSQPNRWYPGIQLFAGTYDITEFRVDSNAVLDADLCFIGDSLTVGYNNVTYSDVWYKQVAENLDLTKSVFAGGGNTTEDILLIIQEIIDANPSNVIMMIGQNDLSLGTSVATIQTNISSIVTELEGAGINVILLANIPNSSTDQKSVADWILTTYPNNSIDLYYPFLLTTSTTNPSTTYLSGSHWTTAGNDAVAQIVTQRLKELL